MNRDADTKRSRYLEWAKCSSGAKFNLATSGLTSVTTAEFPLRVEDVEINGPGGYGYGPLVERIAQHTGAPVDCIVTAAGTSMANHLALATLLGPGDEVVLEEPAYGPLLDVARYLGARVRRVARRLENDFVISLGELEAAITSATRLIVLTNLHNPSGALLTAEALRAIGEIAGRVGALVLVDEAYLEMVFDPPERPCFSLGKNFIVTNSLTKTYGLSSLRCGWVLAAPELARRMWQMNDLFAATPAHPAERLAVVAFDHLEHFRARAAEWLATNRRLLDDFLATRGDLDYFQPGAGTIVFPRLRHGDPAKFFQTLREEYDTSVVPGEFFESPRHFRLGIGGDPEMVRGGLERLGAALDDLA